jgi:ABC-type phosphate transport system permease subunit
MTPPPVNPASMDKVEVIQLSLRCFTMGLIGLLPVLGIPFAIVALSNYFHVNRLVGTQWNPAQTYLTWGLATALCGLFLTVVIAGVFGSMIYLNLA